PKEHHMDTLLAAVPLITILVLMIGFRWSGAKAGVAGWLSALIIAALRFGTGTDVLFWAQIHGLFRAGYVLYIIWGALLFFRVTEADGTLQSMSNLLQQLAPGRILQVLLLAWGFTSFLQGVGGFGVPVAVVAPILVTMGFTALDSVVMASVGHAWAISFGSLGASYEALVSATGIEGPVIAPWMAINLGVICFIVGFTVLWISGGKKSVRQEAGPWLTMAVTMSVVQYIAVRARVENIGAMLGSLAGLFIGSLWALARRSRLPDKQNDPISTEQILRSMLPYLLLIVIIFAVNFVTPLNNLLNQLQLTVQVPRLTLADGRVIPAKLTKAISVFGHPGAQLVYAGLLALGLAAARGSLPPGSGEKIRKGIVRSGVKSTIGILAMMAMATTMQLAGMVTELSSAMAALAGDFFPLITPLIGALGAFMTGSNTNSNVLLGAFQQQVAENLGLYVPLILAFHNAGAATGSVFAPAKIIVGCSTVGLSGGESEALRRTTRYGLIILVILAVLGLLATELLPLS
ncbi:MAG: L-lactate permease, partial [Anaerolineae bacterium]